jgi:hypothetical protein
LRVGALDFRKAKPNQAENERKSERPFRTRFRFHFPFHPATSGAGVEAAPLSRMHLELHAAMELALNVLGRMASYG